MTIAQYTHTILIVEDDQGITDMLSWALDDIGCSVHTALTLATARRLCQELRPDLIIADLVLPDGFGVDVIRQINGRGVTRPVPSIIVSAHPRASEYALNAGADAFLSKPFDLDEFYRTVDHLLGKTPDLMN